LKKITKRKNPPSRRRKSTTNKPIQAAPNTEQLEREKKKIRVKQEEATQKEQLDNI